MKIEELRAISDNARKTIEEMEKQIQIKRDEEKKIRLKSLDNHYVIQYIDSEMFEAATSGEFNVCIDWTENMGVNRTDVAEYYQLKGFQVTFDREQVLPFASSERLNLYWGD